MQYKVLSTLSHLGDRHIVGSIIELTEDEARAFGDDYVEAIKVSAVVEAESKVEPKVEEAAEPEKIKGSKSNKNK